MVLKCHNNYKDFLNKSFMDEYDGEKIDEILHYLRCLRETATENGLTEGELELLIYFCESDSNMREAITHQKFLPCRGYRLAKKLRDKKYIFTERGDNYADQGFRDQGKVTLTSEGRKIFDDFINRFKPSDD